MLKIRLQRVGRKHEPIFRLVVVDSHRSTKSGKYIEVLGNIDSRHGEDAKFESEKIKHWISQGAQTSDTVHNLLVSRKIIDGKKINVLPKKKPIRKDQLPKTGKQQPEVGKENIQKSPTEKDIVEISQVSQSAEEKDAELSESLVPEESKEEYIKEGTLAEEADDAQTEEVKENSQIPAMDESEKREEQ